MEALRQLVVGLATQLVDPSHPLAVEIAKLPIPKTAPLVTTESIADQFNKNTLAAAATRPLKQAVER